MQSAASTGSSTLPEVTSMSAAELAALVRSQAETIATLQHQLDWFRRQIFGQKSERFAPEPDPMQMHLGEVLPVPAQPVEVHKASQPIPGASLRRTAPTPAKPCRSLMSQRSRSRRSSWCTPTRRT